MQMELVKHQIEIRLIAAKSPNDYTNASNDIQATNLEIFYLNGKINKDFTFLRNLDALFGKKEKIFLL